MFFFFFQAEDGIRDSSVTGVQTCALPISNPCTIGTSPVQPLSTGVTFGFDAMGAPPPNTQPFLAQAAACLNGYGGEVGAAALGTIPGTASIEFNSRGLCIDVAGAPTGHGPCYVHNA